MIKKNSSEIVSKECLLIKIFAQDFPPNLCGSATSASGKNDVIHNGMDCMKISGGSQ